MSSSEVLVSNQFLRYKLSMAEQWKEVDLTCCTTRELSAIKAILVRVDRDGCELELRQLLRKVCVLIEEAVSLLLERRQGLPLRTRLFLVLEDRAIQMARNEAASLALTRSGSFVDLIQVGWPGRGDFFNSHTRKRPFWTINRRIRRG